MYLSYIPDVMHNLKVQVHTIGFWYSFQNGKKKYETKSLYPCTLQNGSRNLLRRPPTELKELPLHEFISNMRPF